MKKQRFTESQIMQILKQAEGVMLHKNRTVYLLPTYSNYAGN